MKKTGGKWPGSEQFVKMFAAQKIGFLKQPVYSRDYPPCKYCE